MQWRTYVEQLAEENAATLCNRITVGFGMLALLVHRLARGGALHDDRLALVRIEARLLLVVEQLSQAMAPDAPAIALVPVEAPQLDVRAQLQAIAADAQGAGELMARNAPVAEILVYLRAALIGLHQLRHSHAPEQDDVASP